MTVLDWSNFATTATAVSQNINITNEITDIVTLLSWGVGVGGSLRLAKFLELPPKQVKLVEDVIYASLIGMTIHSFSKVIGVGVDLSRPENVEQFINPIGKGVMSIGKFMSTIAQDGFVRTGAAIAAKSIVADIMGQVMMDLDMMSPHLAKAFKWSMNSMIIAQNAVFGIAEAIWRLLWGVIIKKGFGSMLGVVK